MKLHGALRADTPAASPCPPCVQGLLHHLRWPGRSRHHWRTVRPGGSAQPDYHSVWRCDGGHCSVCRGARHRSYVRAYECSVAVNPVNANLKRLPHLPKLPSLWSQPTMCCHPLPCLAAWLNAVCYSTVVESGYNVPRRWCYDGGTSLSGVGGTQGEGQSGEGQHKGKQARRGGKRASTTHRVAIAMQNSRGEQGKADARGPGTEARSCALKTSAGSPGIRLTSWPACI